MLRLEAAPDVFPRVAAGVTFNSRDAEEHAARAVGAAETAAVTPRTVKVAVVRPGRRPVVAARRKPAMRAEIELGAGDDGTRWIRRLGGDEEVSIPTSARSGSQGAWRGSD